MMALSTIDNVLWDLKGVILGLPMHKLLGGATRDKMEIYASSYPNFEFERIQERAAAIKAVGFRHQKWFFRYGPGAGKEGVDRNILMAKMIREAVGYDVRVMFDCRRAWDTDFAVSVCRGIGQYDPYWVEEPFSVHQLDSHRSLRKATKVPIATGEHLYTRWEAKPYLDEGLVDFLQCDPEWCGGITELVRIVALAQAYSVKVIPHGHLIRLAMHVAISQSPSVCPLCEYIFLGNQETNQFFFKEKHFTRDGFIPAPEKPGLAMEFDQDKIESMREVTFTH
jgi:L-alanine-DL-glutamate epimerase-like enolase superfamily enzyme